MANLAVRLRGPNTDGVPEEWPAETRPLAPGDTTPSGWVTMTASDFEAYKDTNRPAWLASRNVDAFRLSEAKRKKFARIDARTDELISAGMLFGGTTFSLSKNAREKMNNIDGIRADAALAYPVIWNNIDDSATITLANADDVHSMYLMALGTVRSHIDSGTTLKDLVRLAATVDAVDAVADPR